MPAIRRTRREGRDHTAAPGLGSSAPAPASSSSSSSLFSSLPFPFPSSSSDGAGGYSTDTTPFFLRRPHQQSKTSARTDDIVQRGREASGLLGSIGNSMNMETVQIVATSAALLFDVVQTVRTNKTRCIQLLERVHQIVRTIINLLGEASGKGGDSVDGVGTGNSALPPLMLRAIDRFSETLTTLHAALTAQAAHGLLARILRHAETRNQLLSVDYGDEPRVRPHICLCVLHARTPDGPGVFPGIAEPNMRVCGHVSPPCPPAPAPILSIQSIDSCLQRVCGCAAAAATHVVFLSF